MDTVAVQRKEGDKRAGAAVQRAPVPQAEPDQGRGAGSGLPLFMQTGPTKELLDRVSEDLAPVYWGYSADRTLVVVRPKAGVTLAAVAEYLYGDAAAAEPLARVNNLAAAGQGIAGLELRLTGQKLTPLAATHLQSAPKVPVNEDPAMYIARKRQLDDALERDFRQIVAKLDETHYSDADEGEVIALLRRWGEEPFTTNPARYPNGGEYLDLLLRKLQNKSKDVGTITTQQSNYYNLIINHFDRVAEVRAIRDAHSRLYKGDEGIKEMSFGSFFWGQVKEGVVRDQIIGYFVGLGDAAIGFIKGIYTLITDPISVLKAIGQLPQTLATLWEHRQELWNKFANASPMEQGRIIGRIFGEAEIFIATAGAGGGSQAGTAAPRLAMATAVVPGRGVAVMALSGGGSLAVDMARLGEGARMVALTGQLGSVSQKLEQEVGEAASSEAAKAEKAKAPKKPAAKGEKGGATADRYQASKLDEVERLRKNPPQKPRDLDPAHETYWSDYKAYYDKRLADMEGQLQGGKLRSEPPRSWDSYRNIRESRSGQTVRGRAHQERVTRSMEELKADYLTESDVGVSKVKKPGQGDVKYSDQLILERQSGDVTAVSNKSRDFKARVKDYTSAELNGVREQVRADVQELFAKYGGELHVRRPSHPLFNQKVNVREVILVYENRSGLVNRDLMEIIRATARDEAQRLNPAIDFHLAAQ